MAVQSFPKFRWFVLLTIVITAIAQGMVLISPAPLVGEITKSLSMSLGEVTGMMMGSFIICVALSAIVGGVFIDKFGVAKTYIVSMVLLISGSLLILVVGDTTPALVIARFIQGCGAGPIMASIARLAAEWFPKQERDFVTGVQGAGVSIGIAIGFALAPQVFAQLGDWKMAMASMSVGAVIGGILSIIFAFGPKSPVVLQVQDIPGEVSLGAVDFKKSLRLRVFWVGIACVFLLSWAMQGYNDLIPGHLAIEPPVGLGLGPIVAGKYMGALQLAFMMGSIASGFLAQKIFKGAHRYLIATSFLLTGLFCSSILLPQIHTTTNLLVVCLLSAGFFMGIPIPATLAFISNYYPEHITGRVCGTTMGLSIFGGVSGVTIGSITLHHTGLYIVPIIVVCIVCLLGCLSGISLYITQQFNETEDSSLQEEKYS